MGCDFGIFWFACVVCRFQSTHPRGVRPFPPTAVFPELPVSIHAPAWGATACADESLHEAHVSIHAPAWGATATDTRHSDFDNRFNPRTRVGCDGKKRFGRLGRAVVSIHAPAWGATWFIPTRLLWDDFVSIHAPAWGATNRKAHGVPQNAVSIHAPAWGATASSMTPPMQGGRFQSTHPRGVRRHMARDFSAAPVLFQSTHPRGVRHWAGRIKARFYGFNPRTRVGCDAAINQANYEHQKVSIHAPAWGATVLDCLTEARVWVSIHAPAWGATYAY